MTSKQTKQWLVVWIQYTYMEVYYLHKVILRFSGWLTQIFPHMCSKPIQNQGFEWVSCAHMKYFVSTNLKSSVYSQLLPSVVCLDDLVESKKG